MNQSYHVSIVLSIIAHTTHVVECSSEASSFDGSNPQKFGIEVRVNLTSVRLVAGVNELE